MPKQNATIILGIDPGSRATGVAVMEVAGSKVMVKKCDTLRTTHLKEQADRLQYLYKEIGELVRNFTPSTGAIETPVYGRDPQAMLKLGRAQAACILAMKNAGLEITEYLPKAVKKSVTGNGNASKQQVARMLEQTLPLKALGEISKDASDALAVAWCHFMKQSAFSENSGSSTSRQKRSSGGWESFVKNNPDRISSG